MSTANLKFQLDRDAPGSYRRCQRRSLVGQIEDNGTNSLEYDKNPPEGGSVVVTLVEVNLST